jgi:hypothetical protein
LIETGLGAWEFPTSAPPPAQLPEVEIMINTENDKRYGSIRFPMSEITDWDGYTLQYLEEQNLISLEKVNKTKSYAFPGFDAKDYDSEHPFFGSPEWTEKEKDEAKVDLQRFLGRRGLLETELV